MKRIVLATLVAGCTGNADIGISNQPVTCQPNAAGAAHGTVTNTATNKSYTFGAVEVGYSQATGAGIMINDSSLYLGLQISCGQMELGTYEVGAGQMACPFLANGQVSGAQQQVYVTGHSGLVILDQNVGCLAGRYDVDFVTPDAGSTGGTVAAGEVAGWFSIPLP